jgi:hypothetical protein
VAGAARHDRTGTGPRINSGDGTRDPGSPPTLTLTLIGVHGLGGTTVVPRDRAAHRSDMITISVSPSYQYISVL